MQTTQSTGLVSPRMLEGKYHLFWLQSSKGEEKGGGARNSRGTDVNVIQRFKEVDVWYLVAFCVFKFY